MQRKNFCLLLTLFSLLSLSLSGNEGGVENWDRVYLATFPRSGNHWIRFLIEEATNIATGSVYCDSGGITQFDSKANHMSTLFPWGGYCVKNGYNGKCQYPKQNQPVIIKTHFPAAGKKEYEPNKYKKVISTIRNPIDSIYSYYVYTHLNQTGQEIPDHEVESLMKKWKGFYQFWKNQENVLFIRFEDLYSDPKEVLESIFSFIGYDVTENDILRAMRKYPPKGKIGKHKSAFSRSAIEIMNSELQDLLTEFGYEL